MEETKVIVRKKGDVVELHFPGDVTFVEGYDLAMDILERGVNMVAYSIEFMDQKKED